MVYPESESKEQVKPSENQPAEVQETTELHKKLESKASESKNNIRSEKFYFSIL